MFLIDINKTVSIITECLKDADGGELFLEDVSRETITFEDGIITHTDFTTQQGFGLRAFYKDKTVFTHSAEITEAKLAEACNFIKNNKISYADNKTINFEIANAAQESITIDAPTPSRSSFYKDQNILDSRNLPLIRKIGILQEIYNYALSKNSKIKKVKVTLFGEVQKVKIIDKQGRISEDTRPLCRLNIMVIIADQGRFEQGYAGKGGRYSYRKLVEGWRALVDQATAQAEINLEAVPAPAGEMTVVLGSGWPGVILHEAIGHGLEADFNRKGISAFSSLIGQKVASDNVTVVDDGTINERRGSINIDDEGIPSSYNMLIEKGKLVNYMYDLMNAKIMNKHSTGNGRRESYKYMPLPRMTNTYMLGGEYTQDEIISSVKQGLYLISFNGGQVDITSGEFVFSASEGYLISNGKIKEPIKGATLIGNGPDILKRVSMVANNLKLDTGIGTCSKDGQDLPVGVGQPTIKLDRITVGGTQ